MTLDKNANEVQLKTYFDASDILKYHITLCEVFKHKNGKDTEMRQYVLKKMLHVINEQLALYKVESMIVHIFKKNILTEAERLLVIEFFSKIVFKQFKSNPIGSCFKKGLLTVDEMIMAVKSNTKNGGDYTYMNLDNIIDKFSDGKIPKERFTDIKNIFYNLGNFSNFVAMFYGVYWRCKYGGKKQKPMLKEYYNLKKSIHQEKIIFNMIGKNQIMGKWEYLSLFSDVMEEQEQMEILDELIVKRTKNILQHINWRTIEGLKPQALDKYNSFKMLAKLS